MDEEYRLSPDGKVVMSVIDRADQVELDKNDRHVAAVLVGLAEAMTDEQLAETHDALCMKAAEFSSLSYNFLRFAAWLIDNQTAKRRESRRNMEVAFNDGHMMTVGFDPNGPDGRDWFFDCECTPLTTDDDYRATREEALADMTVHMFEHGLAETAIEGVDGPDI